MGRINKENAIAAESRIFLNVLCSFTTKRPITALRRTQCRVPESKELLNPGTSHIHHMKTSEARRVSALRICWGVKALAGLGLNVWGYSNARMVRCRSCSLKLQHQQFHRAVLR